MTDSERTCTKNMGKAKEGNDMMKIAVSIGPDKKVSPHFGRSKQVAIYTVDDSGIKLLETREAPETLSQHDFDFIIDCEAVISGSIGESMKQKLKAAGIIPVVTQGVEPVREIEAIITDE